MFHKIHNPYKECHIMDLNLIGVPAYKRKKLSGSVILTMLVPALLMVAAIATTSMPDMGFIAHCHNIPGGDVCSISFK